MIWGVTFDLTIGRAITPPETLKTITMKTLIDNRITHTIELRTGRQISFEPTATGNPINVGGKWGRVINEGILVDSMPYDKSRWKGVTSHKEVMAEMKRRQAA